MIERNPICPECGSVDFVVREGRYVCAACGQEVTAFASTDDACERAYAEAVAIYRKLSEAESGSLDGTGSAQEAEGTLRKALDLCYLYAELQPYSYLPKAALVLNALGMLYGQTGRISESEEAYLEAIEFCRGFGSAKPDVFLPLLEVSLENLAILYGKTGRPLEGETVSSIVRELKSQTDAPELKATLLKVDCLLDRDDS